MKRSEPPPLHRNRDFMILWSGQAVSALGTSMSVLVFPLIGYAITGSTLLAGVATTAILLGSVVARLPAGALVDRWQRGRVLLTSHLVGAVCYGSLAGATLAHHLTLPHLVAAGFVGDVGEAFFAPAASAAVRTVVPQPQLPIAYSQNQARKHAADLVGPPLGGALYSLARGLPFLLDGDHLRCCRAVSGVDSYAVAGSDDRVTTDSRRHGRRAAVRVAACRHTSDHDLGRGDQLLGHARPRDHHAATHSRRRTPSGDRPHRVDRGGGRTRRRRRRPGNHQTCPDRPHDDCHRHYLGRDRGADGVDDERRHHRRPACRRLRSTAGKQLRDLGLHGSVTPDRLQGRVNAAGGFIANGFQPIAPALAGALIAAAGGRTATIVGAACVAGSLIPLLFSRAIRGLGRPDSWNADPDLAA